MHELLYELLITISGRRHYAPSVMLLVAVFFSLTPPALSQPAGSALENPPHALTHGTEHSYIERAQAYRRAGDTRREQFELTRALRIWPESAALRYAYALHLVRRKNLDEALVHTTHTLAQNRDQPTAANLHLRLLAQLGQHGKSAAWVGQLLVDARAQPPLVPWSAAWLERWRSVLQLGRTHAELGDDSNTQALIDYALHWPAD